METCQLLHTSLAVKSVTLDGLTRCYSQEAFEALRMRPDHQTELLARIPDAEQHARFVRAAVKAGVVCNLVQKPKIAVQIQLGLKLAFQNELNDESDDADSCVQYGDSEGRVFFSDYAPATFKKLRKVCGMDEEHFQRALSCSGEYRMKLTEGLSYCNFYFLDDPSFMLKEVHPAEADKMIEMLPAMLLHLSHNPNSVMVRCVGLYKLSWHTTQNGVSSTRDEWVLCMANLFSTNLRFHQKYDLKGSREGRCVTAEELQMGTQGDFTLRDYAFEELESVIEIGPDMSSRFLEQLERDVQFLCSQNVMDYSLLVGVHHRENGAEENVQSSKLAAEYAHVKSVFEVENGGIPSADGTKIYFVGLVDTLTSYTAKKGWETVFKSCLFDPAQISSVEPPVYMERFMTCARERIK